MKLSSLKYFEKLIETKSYSKVAEYYKVTQPAVSMNIKQLRTELNDNLIIFNKSTESINLTKTGKSLHQHAKKILHQWEDIEAEINAKNLKDINLGISPLISDGYFPNLLNQLTDDKNHKINIIENDTNSLLKGLEFGDLDLVLVESISSINKKGIKAEIIETDQINIIVSKNNRLANKPFIDFRELKDTPFITMPNKFLQAQLFKYFERKYDTSIPVVSCVRDPTLINQIVKKDIGFSFSLNQWLPQDHQDELVALKLKDNELPNFVLSVAYSEEHNLSNREKEIIQTIKKRSDSKNIKS